MTVSTKPFAFGNTYQIETLDGFIHRFGAYLKKRGHTDSTQQAYLSAAKHFYSWLGTTLWNGRKINKEPIQHFLENHLPDCCCPGHVYKDLKTVRAALNQVLSMEGCTRIRPEVGATYPNVESEIERFDAYLQNICGHSQTTRWYRKRLIREFLIWLFCDQCICVDRITADSLCRFVLKKSDSLCSSSIGTVICALRTYLRFLQLNGHVTPSLAATIPKPPTFSGPNLPQALTREELNRFWAVFDLETSVGKRDYAMARLSGGSGFAMS